MRVARAMVAASHPLPTAAVTVLAVAVAAGAGAGPGTLALVAAAVLTGQLSVGWCNDWLDVDRDRAVGRRDKPAATGAVDPRALRTAAFAALATCVLASLATGVRPGAWHLAAVASAWAYDLGLKRTAWSAVPYAVSFGLLPVFLVAAAGRTAPPALVAVGVLLGLGAHVLNVLPDLDDDAATGVRGLPHRLGRRACAVVAPVLLAAAVAVVVLGLSERGGLVLAAGALGLTLAAWAGVLGATRPASRAPFVLSTAVAGVCVVLLVAAGPRLG
jgi:4-hydroxybenzoate polyprenyltransferase